MWLAVLVWFCIDIRHVSVVVGSAGLRAGKLGCVAWELTDQWGPTCPTQVSSSPTWWFTISCGGFTISCGRFIFMWWMHAPSPHEWSAIPVWWIYFSLCRDLLFLHCGSTISKWLMYKIHIVDLRILNGRVTIHVIWWMYIVDGCNILYWGECTDLHTLVVLICTIFSWHLLRLHIVGVSITYRQWHDWWDLTVVLCLMSYFTRLTLFVMISYYSLQLHHCLPYCFRIICQPFRQVFLKLCMLSLCSTDLEAGRFFYYGFFCSRPMAMVTEGR